MKVYRIRHGERIFYATLEEGYFKSLVTGQPGSEPIPTSECTVLPIVVPSKIVCVGLNYKAHAAELDMAIPDEPMIFLKPPSAVIGDNDAIIIPSASQQVDYEGELAVVMGQTTKNVMPHDIAPRIFGYACANDVTARDFQRKDTLFTRAKGFDTFAPIGPCIETDIDVSGLGIRTIVNDKVRQEGTIADMQHSPAELVSYISHHMTLNPGDVILTGTPPGIGTLTAGDRVEVEIEGIGKLSNPVVDDDSLNTPVQ
ncbi:fumarylacetoacetate hydrolase family protein [Desulfovibrio sp. JC010]|uniref:fumarylacetoacetate hydrolase family protein n=1 Tax=Desulfovibrio sp. JC010 TaxID=2593641 RepID=UPI0013D7432D|nr:fumarylacetoacetate hydrolase family protein [Desulfovibrio sp. JC010]NDV28363.1 fumarylacetoacetate hydrolase family protein [Desulfovibrio sp. JC010]